ncbi:hypothetical protein [Longimicrobium terrae]|uniref:Uncharacterized protein n=1 Tax=Longimicrobium terrae TaxID=1639882 RepID=A0A841GS74_9BACT|nr:hypothetical protein [Longimicrobium terrae]MBB4635686.1 hypothetical protein [Longimicrobium terrae]MBB6070080.1 hypothetical protein [Longimicrobium terrae]NNC32983.1 hypothetical protein [Longimicrobium terrae]
MNQDQKPPLAERGRRRMLGLLAASMLMTAVALPLLFWGGRMGIPARRAEIIAVILIFVSGLAMLAGVEPARRDAVDRGAGTAPAPISRAVVLEVLGFSVLVALVSRFVSGAAWADAIGRVPGIAIYLILFHVLARAQRRGVPPWYRPAGYGFALAGLGGGLTWAVIAGASLRHGVAYGLTWSLMHYTWVRYSTRGAADMLARKAGHGGPPLRS